MLKMKVARKAKGWRQEDLAHYARVTVADVSRYETGRMTPYPVHASRIAKVLGLRPEELQKEAEENRVRIPS